MEPDRPSPNWNPRKVSGRYIAVMVSGFFIRFVLKIFVQKSGLKKYLWETIKLQGFGPMKMLHTKLPTNENRRLFFSLCLFNIESTTKETQ